MRKEDLINKSLNIPKKHTLRHYIKLACELYGEPKESAERYAEEQLQANEHDLDKAIDCFKSLVDKNKVDYAARRAEAWNSPKK